MIIIIQKQNMIQTSSPWTVTLSWQNRPISKMTYKHRKLLQTDTVIGLWSEFISCLYMQDNKCLRVAVMICVTLVNTQTHTRRQFLTSYTISSARKWNKVQNEKRRECTLSALVANGNSCYDDNSVYQWWSWHAGAVEKLSERWLMTERHG